MDVDASELGMSVTQFLIEELHGAGYPRSIPAHWYCCNLPLALISTTFAH